MPRYVALLRAIAHVPMAPMRAKLEALGFRDVESYGMSGNLFFDAKGRDAAALERRIANALGTAAFVRTRAQMRRAVSANPFREEPRGIVMFLARAPTPARKAALDALEIVPSKPALKGATLCYVLPGTLRGKRTRLDFERVLGVPGTFRSTSVVKALAERFDRRP